MLMRTNTDRGMLSCVERSEEAVDQWGGSVGGLSTLQHDVERRAPSRHCRYGCSSAALIYKNLIPLWAVIGISNGSGRQLRMKDASRVSRAR